MSKPMTEEQKAKRREQIVAYWEKVKTGEIKHPDNQKKIQIIVHEIGEGNLIFESFDACIDYFVKLSHIHVLSDKTLRKYIDTGNTFSITDNDCKGIKQIREFVFDELYR